MREKQNAKMRFEFPPQKSQTLAQMFGFIEVRGKRTRNARGTERQRERERRTTLTSQTFNIQHR